MVMKAIRVYEPGGPEVMKFEDVEVPQPGPGQALVRVAAAGVNFIDIYFRKGLYPTPENPFSLGMEGGGVVVAVGEGVDTCKPGDRVGWCMERGSYAQFALVPAWKLIPLPEEIEMPTAAQALLQGLTAHYLTRSTFPLAAGQTCLVHAASGGTGTLIVQMAKIAGARVIGTVSNQQKADQAQMAGCDEIINYKKQDFVAEVKRLTEGKGVDVVYDGVGKATFAGGLDCLRPRGMMVLFGQSSGPVGKIDPQVLNQKGSLFLTRPSLGHHVATREDLLARARDLFQWKMTRKLHIFYDRSYSLWDVATAHKDLEKRKSMGKLMLTMG